jgi:hypothetical protein
MMILHGPVTPKRATPKGQGRANQPNGFQIAGKGTTDPVMPDVRTPTRSVLSVRAIVSVAQSLAIISSVLAEN